MGPVFRDKLFGKTIFAVNKLFLGHPLESDLSLKRGTLDEVGRLLSFGESLGK